MSTDNYLAWDINYKDFPTTGSLEKQIEFLLGFAVLAPSAHNTQPWLCRISGNTLKVFKAQNRQIPVGDPNERLLYEAFGGFLENIIIAADFYGFTLEVDTTLEGKEDQSIFSIRFTKVKDAQENAEHLIFQIPKRHTNRYKYSEQNIKPHTLEELRSIALEGLEVIFVQETDIKRTLCEIIDSAQVEAMGEPKFREELSHFVKSNFTKDFVGMPGFTMDVPAPVSIFAPKLIKKFNFSKLNAKKDLDILINHTPVIGIINSQEDSKNSWIKVGQVLQRLCLTASRYGLATSVWAAAVQIEKYRSMIRGELNLSNCPQIMFRLGHPLKKVRPSPRLGLKQILW